MRAGLSLALLLVGSALTLLSMGCARGAEGAQENVTITIHHSSFEPDAVRVPAGVPVTVTLKNEDPIEHEWIVGPPDVHQRHRSGTEPYHDSIPSEVTIPAFSTRVTTVTFPRPMAEQYICHLPGHEAYGMVGTLTAASD